MATEKHEKEELARAEPLPAGQGRRGAPGAAGEVGVLSIAARSTGDVSGNGLWSARCERKYRRRQPWKKCYFFALKQFISIQASGAFFTATSDFEVFHLALELVENQDGFPRILGAERVKTIILSPETWLKD